jgi:hypothetical protein
LSRVGAASPSSFFYVKAVLKKGADPSKIQEAIRLAREAGKPPAR